MRHQRSSHRSPRWHARLLKCVVLALLLAGCGGVIHPARRALGSASLNSAQQRIQGTITVDGRERSYTLLLPSTYTVTASTPLVIALHGGGGSATQFEASSLLTPKADSAGFAVVYPNGTRSGALGLQTWNGGNCCGSAIAEDVDDVNFIRQLIATLTARYAIDPRRVYATGHSNGARLSYRLACELPERIAAIAPNASALMLPVCAPSRPVPVLHMHSSLDANVPYLGGFGIGMSGADYPPLEDTMQRWTTINGCAPTPVVERIADRYTHVLWGECMAGSSVEYYLTDDGGHSWPGGDAGRPGVDPPSTAINANDLLLAFFAKHAQPRRYAVWLPALARG
jgi:polyhydroxybutyrate depolymerase